MRNELPITYDKEKVPSQRITLPNQVKCDVRGLDTKVGQITNYSTSMIAMLPLFKGEKQQEQKLEIEKRLKLLREIQGAEIDKIKGTTPPNFPKEWKQWVKINPEDDNITRAEKYKYNSMVVKKKPYFFIYLYDHLMRDYKEYVKDYDKFSYQMFGCKIKDLIFKLDKTPEEMTLVRKYQKYSPVLETDCVMNNLCKQIEDTSFDISYRRTVGDSLLPSFAKGMEYDSFLISTIIESYKKYKNSRGIKGIQFLLDNEYEQTSNIINGLHNGVSYITEKIREELYGICNNTESLFEHMIHIANQGYITFDFIWDILGEDILDIIPQQNTLIPVLSEKGEEYLGSIYTLKEVIEC